MRRRHPHHRADVTHPAAWVGTDSGTDNGAQGRACMTLGAVVRARNRALADDTLAASPSTLAMVMQGLALTCAKARVDGRPRAPLLAVRDDVVARLRQGSSLRAPLDRLLHFALVLPMTGTEEWAWVAIPGLAEAAAMHAHALTPEQQSRITGVLAHRVGH